MTSGASSPPRRSPTPELDAQVLLALSRDSRDAVDSITADAEKQGVVIDPTPKQDYGFMYGRSFEDPDGHIWEVMWMDVAAMNQAPAPRNRTRLRPPARRRAMNKPTITAYDWVPDFAKGQVRDLRVRWALEEVGQAYEVRYLSQGSQKAPPHRAIQPFGQVPTYEEAT